MLVKVLVIVGISVGICVAMVVMGKVFDNRKAEKDAEAPLRGSLEFRNSS